MGRWHLLRNLGDAVRAAVDRQRATVRRAAKQVGEQGLMPTVAAPAPDRAPSRPRLDELTAASIIAEIGVDMAAFGTAQRLAAWAGVCPANHESAGRPRAPTRETRSTASRHGRA